MTFQDDEGHIQATPIPDDDDPEELLAQLRKAREYLTSTRQNYNFLVYEKKSRPFARQFFASGIVFIMLAVAILVVPIFGLHAKPTQYSNTVAFVILIIGLVFVGVAYHLHYQEENKQFLRNRLEAGLQNVDRLETSLIKTENELVDALQETEA